MLWYHAIYHVTRCRIMLCDAMHGLPHARVCAVGTSPVPNYTTTTTTTTTNNNNKHDNNRDDDDNSDINNSNSNTHDNDNDNTTNNNDNDINHNNINARAVGTSPVPNWGRRCLRAAFFSRARGENFSELHQ